MLGTPGLGSQGTRAGYNVAADIYKAVVGPAKDNLFWGTHTVNYEFHAIHLD